MEVVPGIYQLQLPLTGFPTGYANVYVVPGEAGCLMVDTGWDTEASFDSLKKQLSEIGFALDDIKQIVVTHCHTDHYSMANRLERLSCAEIYVHKLDLEVIESRFNSGDDFIEQTNRFLRQNGVPNAELAGPNPPLPEISPTSNNVVLRGGETIPVGAFNLKVLWTPGHSPGHISLYEPAQKLLFSGDLVLPTIASNIGLHLQYSSNPLADYLKSLNMVKRLEVKMVLPAHEYIFRNLQQRVEELIQRHEQRNTKIMAVIADGTPKTAYRVSRAISWSPESERAGWEGLPSWDKRLAVLETLAHLEFLRFNDKLDKFLADGIVFYRAR